MTDLVTMKDVQDKIREQVKVSMFNLLPDEKVQELVEKEIAAYFDCCTENFFVPSNHHGSKLEIQAAVSPFRLLVWQQLNKVLSANLDKIFNSEEFIKRCIIGDATTGDIESAAMVRQEKIALSMATLMFDSLISESLRRATYDTRSEISRGVVELLLQAGFNR